MVNASSSDEHSNLENLKRSDLSESPHPLATEANIGQQDINPSNQEVQPGNSEPHQKTDRWNLSDEEIKDQLTKLAAENGSKSIRTKNLLEWFGQRRRGRIVTQRINLILDELGLSLVPAIEDADYYGEVTVKSSQKSPTHGKPLNSADTGQEIVDSGKSEKDDVSITNNWILSSLKPDDEKLECLYFHQTVPEALRIMDEVGYERMPLFFDENLKKDLLGTVHYRDLVNSALETGGKDTPVGEVAQSRFLVFHTEDRLMDRIPDIISHGLVYGKNSDGEVVQIYTKHDVVQFLHALTEMFIRTYELEELMRLTLRKLDEGKLKTAIDETKKISLDKIDLDGQGKQLTLDEIKSSEKPTDPVDGLTFAQYIKLFAEKRIWDDLTAESHKEFNKERCLRSLNSARIARNSVMHFRPADRESSDTVIYNAVAFWLRQLSE